MKSLTFSGASTAGATHPTVVDKDGNPVNFGTPTPITFSAGQASVSGGSNGVMTLYKAESVSIGVTDGAIANSGLAVTVNPGALDHFAFALASPQTNATAFGGTDTLAARDLFGNTVTGFDASADNVTITANAPLTGAVSGAIRI